MTAVLVVGPSWVGDLVMAQSLFMSLKQSDPKVEIDVLAPAWSKPLLARMPEVRQAITMPIGHGQLGLGERLRLGRRLRVHCYERAIVLPNSLKSALVPFWARVPHRTGYVGELRWGLLNDVRRLDRKRLPMTVQRFVALGAPAKDPLPPEIPTPHLAVDSRKALQSVVRLGLDKPHGPLLVLCPGAEYGPAKRWPAEYFGTVARRKLEAGWTVWVLGSDRDAEVAQAVCQAAGEGCISVAGRTMLEEAVDLMSLADAVISNDSGLMHVAAALSKPLLAIYGSSDPGFTPPLDAKARVLSLRLPCSPCFKRECPLGHLDCLNKLTPEMAEQALAEMLP